MQDFDFTKHECSKLVVAQEEIKGPFVLMLGLDGSITAGLVVSEQDASRSSGIVSHKWKCKLKWGNERFFPLEFELLLCTCALLSCGPFTAAAMKTFILQQVKWSPLNSFCGSTIFSFTGPKAAGWCLSYSLHPLSSRASGITSNVRRKC